MCISRPRKQPPPKCTRWTQGCEEEVSAPERALLFFVRDGTETQALVVLIQMHLNFKDLLYGTMFAL